MQQSEDISTYVFEQCEVKKTGRTATKKFSSGKIETIFEVTPVNLDVGSWKKWVSDTQMHEVAK